MWKKFTLINKTTILQVVIVSIFCSILPSPAFAFSGSGSGTSGSPYLITSCAELAEVNDDKTATYRLEQDLDCTSSGNSIIIGGLNSFDGTFLGNNKDITIAITDAGEDYQGLFTHLLGATISNLTIKGSVAGREYVGGLTGYSYNSTITNVLVMANVTGTENYVGGVIGDATDSTINTIRATGTVTGPDYVGGAIGVLANSNVINSWASGDVTGVGNVGGFVGQTYTNSFIENSYSTGSVTATGWEVGGFVGDADSVTINKSYSTGNVTGGGYTGGFVGNTESAVITNAYARGSVTSDDDYNGAFVGYMNGDSITNVYSTGSVVNVSFTGGLSGEIATGSVTSSFWDTQTSGWVTSYGDEVGKTTAQLKSIATFTTEISPSGWNFDTIWDINSARNDGYPYFRWQEFDETPSPTPTQTPVSSSGSRTSAQSGGPVRTYVCSDIAPLGNPTLFELRPGATTTDLFFTPLLETNQYYISFSTSPLAEEHGALVTLGSAGVQKFTVDHLKPNTTYYFKVRGQYGCNTGEWSSISVVTTKAITNSSVKTLR